MFYKFGVKRVEIPAAPSARWMSLLNIKIVRVRIWEDEKMSGLLTRADKGNLLSANLQ